MEVVAEGVETWADWRLLEGLGRDAAQGFVAARPVAAAGIPLFAQPGPSTCTERRQAQLLAAIR
ncbi:MAG: hypothetical protein AB1651_13300 [Pseudomonadota bacterium]